jgi:hypothetical protein
VPAGGVKVRMVKASWLVGVATCRPYDRRESLHEYPTDEADRDRH